MAVPVAASTNQPSGMRKPRSAYWIRLPGERRTACRDARSRDGIPVPAPLLAQLDKLAADLGDRAAARTVTSIRLEFALIPA
jgi:LDH2 family malate/lactate/ureidoglycolate dehydrogenase